MHATTTPRLRRRALLLSTVAMLAMCPLAPAAQPGPRIWRCGNQYTDQPCPSGRALETVEAPTPEARAATDTATQRTREQADAMARDRERREAEAAGRPPTVIAHPSPWAARDEDDPRALTHRTRRPKTQKGRHPRSDGFTAKGPSTEGRKGQR